MSNVRNTHDKKSTSSEHTINNTVIFTAGIFTAVFCSGLFNPWDRALYLSVKNNKPFLSLDNFRNPYQGFSQAVFQRAFLGSVYYIMQGELKRYLHPYLRNNLNANETVAQFCIGVTAGSINGLINNSISTVKYHVWGQESRSFFSSAYEMYSQGGIKPFIKGTKATIGRDIIFGSTYEVTRHLMRTHFPQDTDSKDNYINFLYTCISAGLATIASGPLNYARSIQYATPPQEKSPKISTILKNLWVESKQHNQISFFQKKFRLGWGTARVAVGVSLGQKVFDVTCKTLNPN